MPETRRLVLSLCALAAIALSQGCGREPPDSAASRPHPTGSYEGRVVQTIRGTPPLERESELSVEFDESGRLASWEGRPLRSYVLSRLLEEQKCGGASADSLLAPGAVLQVACPDDLTVTFRTLEYRTEPDFGLVVELASEGTPLPSGSGRTRGRGSELYRVTGDGLEVAIFLELVFEQDEGEALRIEQRIEGVLPARP